MQVDDFSPVDPNVDYEKILPIHQKRMITFINHFVSNTVVFLNNFAQSCESRLMEFEHKIQKLEAALLITESQLSSIPGLNETISQNSKNADEVASNNSLIVESESFNNNSVDTQAESVNEKGPSAIEDNRFSRFFKMIQVGVPLQAVKNKMIIEGLDPSILDRPNDVVP